MRQLFYIIIFQCILLGHESRFSSVWALIGKNVKSSRSNEFPSVACVLKYNPNGSWRDKMLCTATFISQTHLLTAEHCFTEAASAQVEIALAVHQLDDAIRYYPIWWVSYNHWMKANNREITTKDNDITILRIIGMTENIIPSNIQYVHPANLLRGLHVHAVGCGLIDNNTLPTVLQKAALRIIDYNECVKLSSELQGYSVPLSQEYLCTVANPYVFLELGDSGGPLFLQNSLIAVNVAVCPMMNNQFHPGKANAHINLGFYRDYITAILSD